MPGDNPTPQQREMNATDVQAVTTARAVGAPAANPVKPDAAFAPLPDSAPIKETGTAQEPTVGVVATSTASPKSSPSPAVQAAAAHPMPLPGLSATGAERRDHDIELLSDVELNVKIELGRATMLIEDVLKLGEGSVVELDKLAGDPVDVLVNDRLVARGEVLVLNDNFCVRISEIVAGDGVAA
jgi:flagellar motor switch protein FliN